MTPLTKIDITEFYAMYHRGEFADRNVELLDGEVIDKPMQNNHHWLSIEKGYRQLTTVFGPQNTVRSQGTLDLSPHSVPDPDLAVVDGPLVANSGEDNPTTALLIVEVSGSTLAKDRGLKAGIYAAAGIRDYWIVNFEDRVLEVHRDPVSDPSAEVGYSYSNVTTHGETEFVSPLALPTGRVAVRDLLP